MTRRPRRRWCAAAITGAGSGLGREIALGLAAKGCIVFGTAMASAEVQELKAASGGRVSLAVCDVTKSNMVDVWASGVSEALDGAGLDLLVNIPDLAPPFPLEALPLDRLRHVFEHDVFGAVSVVNAFLPALRRSRGRIVQVSDWSASLALPFDGASAASKTAIEALASVYRAELKPFGIDVIVASVGRLSGPAPTRPPGTGESAATPMSAEQRDLYASRLNAFRRHVEGQQPPFLDLAEAAALVIEIAEREIPPCRVAIGSEAETMLRAARERSEEELGELRLRLAGLA